MDRLNKKEIIEVIRILRNVANFKNTIFICGFDKNYVLKIGGFDTNFLDKIFNLEIKLPKLPHNNLLAQLSELIMASKTLDNKEQIIKTIYSLFDSDTGSRSIFKDESKENKIIPLTPSLFFETRRDVKRFYNSLYINISILNIDDVQLSDYLLYNLLIYKYWWLQPYFYNKRINNWLGNSSTLELNEENIDNLYKDRHIDIIDKNTIYTVLKRLFSTSTVDTHNNTINQRRYLPIYINYNTTNQSFSPSELLKAHKQHSIIELIESNIKGKTNENDLLNDVKYFILKQENIQTVDEYLQCIKVIKSYLEKKISNSELLDFIYIGERNIEGFKDIIDTEIFNNIDDVFGQFLRGLNLRYTQKPNDLSMNKGGLDSHINSTKIKELKIITSRYVKERIIQLYKEFIKGKSIIIASSVAFDCTNNYYPIFNFRMYYKEVTDLLSEHFKNNLKEIFIGKEPTEFIRIYQPIFIASIFASDETKKEIIKQADDLINAKNSLSRNNLNRKEFVRVGWNRFIKFFDLKVKRMNLTEDETIKAKEFSDFIKMYRSNNFSMKK